MSIAITIPALQCVDAVVASFVDNPKRLVEITGAWGSSKTLAALQTAKRLEAPTLFIASGRIEAESVYDDLCTFLGEDQCVLFPAWEVLPSDAMEPADDIVAERMNALRRLADAANTGQPLHVVMPTRSLLQYVIPRQRLAEDTLTLQVGEEYDLDDLLAALIKRGYKRELMVEQRGEISVRGGIVDIFPISEELPYRLEFFGDELETVRRFEPETQRSVDYVDVVNIAPRSEKALLASGEMACVMEYFARETLVALDEPMAIAEEAEKLDRQFGDSAHLMAWHEAQAAFRAFRTLHVSQVAYDKSSDTLRINARINSVTGWGRNVEGFWAQLADWDKGGNSVRIFCINAGERRRMVELLEEHGYEPDQGRFDLSVCLGRLRAGFAAPDDHLACLSEREIFGRRYMRRRRRRFEAGATITAFSDLRVGDYVVHVTHGIARYLGLKRFEGKAGDFLTLQYAGGDKLYLPVTHIDLVQKYSAGEDAQPKIDKMGGRTWARTKARVKKAVQDMTRELLELYAARESIQGRAFKADTHWQHEFEDAFEYDETPDQLRAIADVKSDMEGVKPMERLLCGDVGYGKTEVAVRAAFKAAMEGVQVAVLVPTTVLAQQHFDTFRERMADYPIVIEQLSRFVNPKDQKAIVERLKTGEVDVVIGTHRLTSKDVKFKDLGLVIVDEEQRFGVAQKEKLKQLCKNVDVLTMTATPIPRTLHFSLSGVRDMSVINTAPNDRLPIHTCIDAFDESLIREAIERELAREGQVFFLHNRVQTILSMATMVRRLVPGARIGVGHGQMARHELEHVMAAFVRKEIDVLVCTTIIGSGVDIPNANTIIVNRADCFGLSELYQIRGRVGRYKHRAFAYLLVPGDKALSEEAQKRLKALEEFSSLGSGFRIAMRDLEIRGCGNILGHRQSGHIATVGYDTYAQLIQEAIAELKGEPVVDRTLPSFDIATEAHIPEDYVPSEAQRITLYKRVASVKSVDEVDELREEFADRFGALPAPVKRLLDVMTVRAKGADLGVAKIAASQNTIAVEFHTGTFISRRACTELEHRFGKAIAFSRDEQLSITLIPRDTSEQGIAEQSALLLDVIEEVLHGDH